MNNPAKMETSPATTAAAKPPRYLVHKREWFDAEQLTQDGLPFIIWDYTEGQELASCVCEVAAQKVADHLNRKEAERNG